MIYLSIIITTYNNETYIRKCIESIKYQKNIEIIVVNDCSTDNTKKILEQYKYIKVINLKKNVGVSQARNIALKLIKGKYFTFLDGDDQLLKYAEKKIIRDIKKYNSDIIIYNYYEKNKKYSVSKYNYKNEIIDNKEATKRLLTDKIAPTVWAKVYKQKYKNIRFNEELEINEDCDYTIKILTKSNKTIIKNDYIYIYNKENSSLTKKYTCEQIKKNDYIKYISNNIKKNENYEYYKELHELKKIHLYSQCNKKRYKYLKENIDRRIIKKLLKRDITLSYKFEIIIYLISIKLHLILFKYYFKIRNIKRMNKSEIYNNNNSIQ